MRTMFPQIQNGSIDWTMQAKEQCPPSRPHGQSQQLCPETVQGCRLAQGQGRDGARAYSLSFRVPAQEGA